MKSIALSNQEIAFEFELLAQLKL